MEDFKKKVPQNIKYKFLNGIMERREVLEQKIKRGSSIQGTLFFAQCVS